MGGPGVVTTIKHSNGRFPKECELDDSLEIDKNGRVCCNRHRISNQTNLVSCPPTLPGHPTRELSDKNVLEAFLRKEFITPKLDIMAPHLWLVATPNHSMISALHAQTVRGRKIIIAEDPELHLVWYDDKVFIKPIPPYLMSHAIWERYLDSKQNSLLSPLTFGPLKPAILGYMRSWTYLVSHESDFKIAKKEGLIPETIKFEDFMRFLSFFTSLAISDAEVTQRYRFGQLRLSRLNMWAKLFLRRREFEQMQWQYWQYFQTFYGPLLFIFAVFTVILSAMQVGVTSPDIWPAFSAASVWFSVATLLVISAIALALVLIFVIMSMKEIIFAVTALLKKKKPKSSGVGEP